MLCSNKKVVYVPRVVVVSIVHAEIFLLLVVRGLAPIKPVGHGLLFSLYVCKICILAAP